MISEDKKKKLLKDFMEGRSVGGSAHSLGVRVDEAKEYINSLYPCYDDDGNYRIVVKGELCYLPEEDIIDIAISCLEKGCRIDRIDTLLGFKPANLTSKIRAHRDYASAVARGKTYNKESRESFERRMAVMKDRYAGTLNHNEVLRLYDDIKSMQNLLHSAPYYLKEEYILSSLPDLLTSLSILVNARILEDEKAGFTKDF